MVALQAAMEGAALIKAIFRVLKASVRCDFVNVCLRNVQTEAGNLSFRMIDSRGRDFGPEMLREVFFREHPGMPQLMANPGVRFINTREILAPQETLQQTRFYREVMQVIGFRHAVGMFFWTRPPTTPEAIFSLLRAEGQTDFADEEIAVLNRIYPQIDAALSRVRTAEDERMAHHELHARARRLTDAVCVLDWDLRVTNATFQAREMCAFWQHGSENDQRLKIPRFCLPRLLRQVCDELKNRWHDSLGNRSACGFAVHETVKHPSVPGLQATVTLQLARSTPIGRPGFVVEFRKRPSQSRSVHQGRPVGSWPPLTAREREVGRLVCEGRSNKEIALQTHLAVGTVKNVLYAVFYKLGVPNRTSLSALLRTPATRGKTLGTHTTS